MIPLWRKNFLPIEYGLAVVVTCGFAIWIFLFEGVQHINVILASNRATLYGTLASISGSLLGFVLTASSIVLSLSNSPSLAILRNSKHYPTLWKIFNATIKTLAFSTFTTLTCLLFDRDNKPVTWLVVPAIFAVILSCFRLMRTIWAFERVISLVTQEHAGMQK